MNHPIPRLATPALPCQMQNKDTQSQPKSGPTGAEISKYMAEVAAEMQHMDPVCRTHEQIMSYLLTQVKNVDFRERAGFDPGDEQAKLKKNHYLITVVDEVLKLAEVQNWGICRCDDNFYIYNGAHWKVIKKGTLKAFLKQAAELMGIDRFTAHYVEFANDLFEQFKETAYMPAPIPNRDLVKINLANGTFEISSINQRLRAPNAGDFMRYQLPFTYAPTATAPQFWRFLNQVLPDLDCQKILAEYLGYLFISPAKLKLEKALLLYGTGANGKSVFFEIVTALLGPDNISHFSLQSLTTEPAYCRASLADKLVNYASEINGRLDANTFKQMVSGEPIEARLPYGQPFTMSEYAKLIFNCNELPADVEQTPAYFRRFLIIPFGVTIPDQEQDKELAAKIIGSELSGVFNWVMDGLRRLLAQGRFTDSDVVREQIELYKRQSDSVRLFLDEQGYQPDTDRYTSLKDIYQEYKTFCAEDGYRPVKKLNFRKRIESYGIETSDRNIGKVVFVQKPGIGF